MKKNELLNGTVLVEAELRNRIMTGVNLTLNAINECLANAECVQDIEQCVEQQKILYNVYKSGVSQECGFTIEECNDIIKKFGIEEVEWDKVDEMLIAKRMEIIEKSLAVFEDISYEERWANDMRFCSNEDEFNEYVQYIVTTYGADEETSGEFEGIGYYDYAWDLFPIKIAGLSGPYTDEITNEIMDMDETLKVVQERKLDRQIEAYMNYLGLKKYECTMDFKSKNVTGSKAIEGIDRLESFLNEMRRFAFVFHPRVEQKYIYENIENFTFTYYIEEEKQYDLEFDIINSYKRGMEDFIKYGRTF